jgi:branched-chain amino acid transport system substrate-binding protein
VALVAGHYCSGSSIPASKVYGEEGVLQISPASTNPKYTDEGGWNTFRVCGRDDQQGQVAGSYIARSYRGKRVAILHDNSAYGKGLADETKKAMNAAGAQEALYAAYTAGESDYNALVSRLKQERIEVIYVGGYYREAGLIIRQAKEQGLAATLIGGDALVTNEFWSISGAAGEGSLMTFSSDPRKRATAAQVVQAFRARNVDPEGYVLYTYAAIQDLGRGGGEDQGRLGPQGGRCAEAPGALGFRAGADQLHPQGRRDGAGLRVLRVAQRQLRRDVTADFPCPARRGWRTLSPIRNRTERR